MQIFIKRIYDPPADDGFQVLVDRLWPRGVKREDARIGLWAKELAPTTDLRRWFNHDTTKFGEFRSRYLRELESKIEHVRRLFAAAENKKITLLFAARDRSCNHAVVLQEYLSGLDLG
jgi:uncharacterized protein YeaO (DUF488 family)